MTVFKLLACEMNRKAAGQETDGEEDRCLQHFAGSRSGNALPQIKKVRDDENAEDRRLCDDEASHPDLASVWKLPLEISLEERTRDVTHFSILPFTHSDCPGLPGASGPTGAGGSQPQEWKQSCKPEAVNLPTIPGSRRPTDRCQLLVL